MPNTLITLGLIPAIRELISEISITSDLKINFQSDPNFKGLNEDQTINLYRIIQEALLTILKDAQASMVDVNLTLEDGNSKAIYIKDNGVGMSASKIKNLNGIGWKNIYSRVALLMGKIDVTSKTNEGTQIAIRLAH